MAQYTPGAHGFGTPLDYSFVSTFDIHKPEHNPELVMKFGKEQLTTLLELVGNYKEVEALEYNHWENQRLMPKISATTAGAGAGAQATFTVAAAGINTVTLNPSPYDTSTTVTQKGLPVRANDIILIKPSSGTVSASTYIRAFVDSVNTTAGTFLATPLDSSDSIPAIASASEIIITGNAHGEGSGRPTSLKSQVVKKTNNLQTIKETYDITGYEQNVKTWVRFEGKNGKIQERYALKGETDTYYRFKNYIELTMLIQEKLNNTTIANSQATNGTPIMMTEGLIPFILSGGTVQNYSSVTGYTLADAQTLVKNLDTQKGSMNNLLLAGINLSLQLDDALADRVKEGAITYGNFTFNEENKVNMEFTKFRIGEYIFNKKTYRVFNDLQTFGASGYGFPNEGMIIPMDEQVDAKTRERIPSLSVRYLKDREMSVIPVDLRRVGDTGQDKIEVRYDTTRGFQGFAANRFAYIKRA